jgi:hypothetical protein
MYVNKDDIIKLLRNKEDWGGVVSVDEIVMIIERLPSLDNNPSKIDRYVLDQSNVMMKKDSGDYVLYEDHLCKMSKREIQNGLL